MYVPCCCILDLCVCLIFFDYDSKLIHSFEILGLKDEYVDAINKFYAMAQRNYSTLVSMPTYGRAAVRDSANFIFAMRHLRCYIEKYRKLASFQKDASDNTSILSK